MTRFIALLLCAVCAQLAVSTATAEAREIDSHHSGLSFSGYSWHVYTSGKWAPGHTWVKNGILSMLVSGRKGGGASMNLDKVYGSWKVRFRMSRGAGSKYVILLWPAHGSRPEIDFAEDNVGDARRLRMNGTFHPKPGCNGCTHLRVGGNFSTWHTAGLIWNAHGLSFTLDGRVWAHLSTSPHSPMHLAIQSTAYGAGPPAILQVSSVHVS